MENILSLQGVVKHYYKTAAVDDVSFNVRKGSIFGLLGPNGAGKTSLIRIITTITGADEGQIFLDGEKLNLDHPRVIGYMPEERGLYKKMKVGEQLLYLAQLKGLGKKEAKSNIISWMEKLDIASWWDKKVEELSKGMQQKVQFVATVMHHPKLLILDEPFTGLDPVNTNLIKEEIRKMNQDGVSVIFSTHRMEQVEEICEDIVLINNGKKVLEGKVKDIKNQFKENKFRVGFKGTLPEDISKKTFEVVSDDKEELIIRVKEGHRSNDFLQTLINKGITITSYNEILPTLNEIFIKQVNDWNHE